MKNIWKKTGAVLMSATMIFTVASCGAQFNTVGISMGNQVNGGEVTSQNDTTYYIKDGDIYKTDDVTKEGKRISEGDMANINAVGEKLYYYDNSISTICKANSEGDKIERIAELYCDKFTVSKDNIYASVLTGQGGENLEDSDNYSIVRLKITDRKIASAMPQMLVEKSRLIGCVGDNIYASKKTKDGEFLYRYDPEGKNATKMMEIPKDGEVIADSSAIYIMGTVDGAYGLYKYSLEGKAQGKLADVSKNTEIGKNAFNVYEGYIYYEDCVKDADGKVFDRIMRTDEKGEKKEKIMERTKATEYDLAAASGGIMVKYKDAGDIKTQPNWEPLEKESK